MTAIGERIGNVGKLIQINTNLLHLVNYEEHMINCKEL